MVRITGTPMNCSNCTCNFSGSGFAVGPCCVESIGIACNGFLANTCTLVIPPGTFSVPPMGFPDFTSLNNTTATVYLTDNRANLGPYIAGSSCPGPTDICGTWPIYVSASFAQPSGNYFWALWPAPDSSYWILRLIFDNGINTVCSGGIVQWKFNSAGWVCNNGSNVMVWDPGTDPGPTGSITVQTNTGNATLQGDLFYPDILYLTIMDAVGFPCLGSFMLFRDNVDFPLPQCVGGAAFPYYRIHYTSDTNICDDGTCQYKVDLICDVPAFLALQTYYLVFQTRPDAGGPYTTVFMDAGVTPGGALPETGQECDPFMLVFDYRSGLPYPMDCLGAFQNWSFFAVVTE